MRIKKLIQKVVSLKKDPRNQRLKEFWNRFYSFEEPEKVPITVGFSRSYWAQTMGINLVRMFEKPENYLEDTLKIIIFRHKKFLDDGLVGATVSGAETTEITAEQSGEILVYFGPPFETSLFGIETIFSPDKDPIRGKPIINSEEDFENLNYPDFYESGLMLKTHEFYEKISKMVGDNLKVVFPTFCCGQFGIAWSLRGLKNLVIDIFTRPDFAHKLMRFITESRIRYEKERMKFIGSKPERPQLDNDEVNCEIISPKIYKEFIFPYERKIAEFYERGIFYFHSCGDLTPIYDMIMKFPGLKRLEISPWSDLNIAVEKFKSQEIIFHKRLHPLKDVHCERQDMKARLEEILDAGSEAIMELDAAPLSEPIEKVNEWICTARNVVKERSRSVFENGV